MANYLIHRYIKVGQEWPYRLDDRYIVHISSREEDDGLDVWSLAASEPEAIVEEKNRG